MFTLRPIGHVSSPLVQRDEAPKQGFEGAPAAWLEFVPSMEAGLRDLRTGEDAAEHEYLHPLRVRNSRAPRVVREVAIGAGA